MLMYNYHYNNVTVDDDDTGDVTDNDSGNICLCH